MLSSYPAVERQAPGDGVESSRVTSLAFCDHACVFPPLLQVPLEFPDDPLPDVPVDCPSCHRAVCSSCRSKWHNGLVGMTLGLNEWVVRVMTDPVVVISTVGNCDDVNVFYQAVGVYASKWLCLHGKAGQLLHGIGTWPGCHCNFVRSMPCVVAVRAGLRAAPVFAFHTADAGGQQQAAAAAATRSRHPHPLNSSGSCRGRSSSGVSTQPP
jgi:hypothetical protein